MKKMCKNNFTFNKISVFSCISYSIFAYIKKLRFPIGLICHA
ncbi:hypothetical protein [Anaerococcus sp. mt242]|nr:hypothetical protein [Anaerococcus sp. mt242]